MNIAQICKKYEIKNYSINPDGSIDVDGDVRIYDKGLKKIPLKFNNVIGDFWCQRNQLTTLKGAPKTVGGDFWCDRNQLTTLEGGPKTVGGDFVCSYNRLTTLEGAPKTVGDYFWCYNNQLLPYNMRYVLFSDISSDFISNINDINEIMTHYFSLSEQEKKQEIFKILAKLKAMS